MPMSLRTLPLNALRSFDAAARHLSFATAAAELGVTPAAISVQVRRLEQWVGSPLFVRGHRSIALSAAGRSLAPRLTALFTEMERLLAQVSAIDANTLQISAMASFVSNWVSPRLGRFTAAHPDLQLRIAAADERADFERDGVDIALRYGDGHYGDLHVELIAQARATPVCSPALAARYADDPAAIPAALLLQDESALIAPGLPTWAAWFALVGVARDDADGGPLFNRSHMALDAAAADQGFALGLAPLIDHDLASGQLVAPFTTAIDSPFGFWFVCRPDRLDEPKIAAFRAWLFAEASAG